MFKKEYIDKIFVKSGKVFIEYQGGANFLDGLRDCTSCKNKMIRHPLQQSYINAENGKILIDINLEGRAILSNTEPHYLWRCQKCSEIIRPKLKIKKPVIPEIEEAK